MARITPKKARMVKALKKLSTEELLELIEFLDKNGITFLCEAIYNILHTDYNLPKSKQRKIKTALNNEKSRKNIKIITKRGASIAKKRAALLQEGEGIGLILSALAPLIAGLFTGK